MTLEDLFDKAKDTASVAKDSAVDWIDSGKVKLQEGMTSATEETNKLLTILKESGFTIGDMTINISATPRSNSVLKIRGAGETTFTSS